MLVISFCVTHRFVWFAMIVTGLLSYPLSKLLDWVLGADHGTQRFRRNELKELVKLHGSDSLRANLESPSGGLGLGSEEDSRENGSDALTAEEVSIIRGALRSDCPLSFIVYICDDELNCFSLREKTITEEVYTPLSKIFAIEVHSVLDEQLREEIDRTYTRYFV